MFPTVTVTKSPFCCCSVSTRLFILWKLIFSWFDPNQPDSTDLCLKCQGLPQAGQWAALMPVLLAREFPLGGSERGSNGAVMRPAGQAIPHTAPSTPTPARSPKFGALQYLTIPACNTLQYLLTVYSGKQRIWGQGVSARSGSRGLTRKNSQLWLQYLDFTKHRSCRDGESKLLIEIVMKANLGQLAPKS